MPPYNAERIAVQRASQAQAPRRHHKRLYRSSSEMPQHLHPNRILRRSSAKRFLAYSSVGENYALHVPWALSGHLIFSLSPELICHTYFDAVSNRRLETPNQIDLAINRLSNLKRMTCRKVGEHGAGDDQRGTWSDIRQFCNLGWRMMRDLGLRTVWRARTLLVKAYCLVQAGSSPSVPQ